VPGLLERRVLVVAGKGGVGKSVVAATLGLLASRHGRRTLVAEVSARQDVPRLFAGHPVGRFREVELAPGLKHIAIDPAHALEDYLAGELRSGALGAALARARPFRLLVEATPGMNELLSMGKVWELAQPARRSRRRSYDLVVLDAPATGHALALLTAPRTFAGIARVGPVARQAAQIDAMLRDPARTGAVVVTTAEEMPVNETIDLRDGLEVALGLGVGLLVVNRMLPRRFSAADEETLRQLPEGPAAGSARWLRRRSRSQAAELRRVRHAMGAVPSTTLPFSFAGEVGRAELDRMAGSLERML